MKTYTVKEAAALMKCSPATIRALYKEGLLNGCRAGRPISFTAEEILACRKRLEQMERAKLARKKEVMRRLAASGIARRRRKPLPRLTIAV